MIPCFLPPLQHIVAVRIALCLHNDKDIKAMLEIINKIPLRYGGHNHGLVEFWKLIEKQAAEKLPSLPGKLKTRVCKFIRPIQEEIRQWLFEHDFLEEDCRSFDYKSILCWKSEGTIDKTQTARNFVRSKYIQREKRFALACTYFLEDDIQALWHGDEVLELESFRLEYGSNAALRFWIQRLKSRSLIPWKACVDGYFKNLRTRQLGKKLRISCFFPYLSWEGKKNSLNCLRWFEGYGDDFLLCLREMSKPELMRTISAYPLNFLLCFLDWPLQSLFIDMAGQLCKHMDFNELKDIFYFIICDKILKGSGDFDYIRLLKEFWQLCPASHKRQMMNYEIIFKWIVATLNYDDTNAPLSLPETMVKLLGE